MVRVAGYTSCSLPIERCALYSGGTKLRWPDQTKDDLCTEPVNPCYPCFPVFFHPFFVKGL